MLNAQYNNGSNTRIEAFSFYEINNMQVQITFPINIINLRIYNYLRTENLVVGQKGYKKYILYKENVEQ